MRLDGKQIKQLHEALLSAFPFDTDLRLLIQTDTELQGSEESISWDKGRSAIVMALRAWAESQGKLVRLVEHAFSENRDNPELRRFVEVHGKTLGLSCNTPTLSSEMRKPLFSDLCVEFEDVLTPYLDWIINSNNTLDPRGLGKDLKSGALPLDRIYVSLALERKARHGLEDDLLERARELAETEGMLREAADKTESEEMDRQQEELLRDKREKGLQAKPVSPVEALRQQTRTVIIGKPGCGKTTLLRYLARHFAEACKVGAERVIVREIEDFGETRLPILLRIAYYADACKIKRDLGLRDYLPRAFSDAGVSEKRLATCFQAFLQAGYGLLLLDGLDEVTHFGVRGQIAARIDSLAAGCGGNPIVVTSRIAGYRASPLGAEFTEYKLLDMTSEQISEFLSRYCPIYERALKEHGTDAEIEIQATANRKAIEAALEKNVGVRRLATNPLLLAILTVIQSMHKRLPHHRVELYKHTVEIVLMYHPMQRGFLEQETIGNEEALPLFGPMALWLHREHSSGMARESDVRARFADALSEVLGEPVDSREVRSKVEDFLWRAREATGLFVERATGYYGFSHLTFEEYFTARQMVSDYYDLPANIQKWRHLPRWEEPILLAISYVSTDSGKRASDLIRSALLGQTIDRISGEYSPSADEDILHRDLLLAAQCLGDCVRADAALYEDIAAKLVSLYLDLCTKKRCAPLRSRLLDRIEYLSGTRGGLHAAELLRKALEDHMAGQPIVVMDGLRRLRPLPEKAIMALVALMSHSDGAVRRNAMEILTSIRPLPDEAIKTLVALMSHSDASMQRSAAQTLLSVGECVEEAITTLVAMLSGRTGSMRRRVVLTLNSVHPLPDEASTCLMNLLSDPTASVRMIAAQTLLSAGICIEEAIITLINLLSHRTIFVWRRAAQTLLSMGGHMDEVITFLVALLSDVDASVRRSAMEMLNSVRPLPNEAITALVVLLSHPDSSVRMSAVKALLSTGECVEEAITVLITLMSDKVPFVRMSAVQTLNRVHHLPDEAVKGLIALLSDTDGSVRRSVVQALNSVRPLPDEAIIVLVTLLLDPIASVRRRAVQALNSVHPLPDEAITDLVALLSHQDVFVRRSAAQILLSAGEWVEEAIMVLVTLMSDEGPSVRMSAAQILLSAGECADQAITVLLTLMLDADTDVWMNAAEGLGNYCAGSDTKLDHGTVQKIIFTLRTILHRLDNEEKILSKSYGRVYDCAWEALWKIVARQKWEPE